MAGKTIEEFINELKAQQEQLNKERELPNTSKKVLEIIKNQLVEQNKKGLNEYGKTIDDADDSQYDWNFEALAECADALQYLVKENARLKKALGMAERAYNNLLRDYDTLGKLYQLQAERNKNSLWYKNELRKGEK